MRELKYCPRCGKSFPHRGNLNNHLRKQKICPALIEDIDRNDIILNYHKYMKNFSAVTVEDTLVVKNDKKQNQDFNQDLDMGIQEILAEHIGDVDGKISSKLNAIITQKINQKMEDLQIKYNVNGNIAQGNSKQINQQVYITVNSYGNEDLSHISNKDWRDIINKKDYAIPELAKKIHVDQESNRNIFIPSFKQKYSLTYTGDKWELEETSKILKDIIIKNADLIYEYLETHKSEFKNKEYYRMDEILDKLGIDNMLVKEYQDQIKLMFINNRDLIKDTYEEKSGKKLCY